MNNNEIERFAEKHQQFSKFHIDICRLEEEWVEQPNMVERASDRFAIAKREAAIAEDALELIEAQLKMKVMRDPVKYGLDKPTVDAIKATVLVQPQYREARNAVIDANYRVDKLKGDLTTLEHRKKGLETLASLWSQSYFSTPRAPAGMQAKLEQSKMEKAFSHPPIKP